MVRVPRVRPTRRFRIVVHLTATPETDPHARSARAIAAEVRAWLGDLRAEVTRLTVTEVRR
jgi:hypothetical protein